MLTMYNNKKDFEQREILTAVLPVGAVEQHGSHLPVGTDTLLAGEFARRLAERLDAYLLPTIPITSSVEHRKGKGTVYIKGETLALILGDIAESLQYAGYTKLIIVNFHGGNWIIKPTVRRLNRELRLLTVLVDANVAYHRHHEIVQHIQHDIHAGEFETSLMLHLYPDYVGAIKKQLQPKFYPQAYMDYFDTTELTEDGYWGFPEEGTAGKGQQLIELMVNCALEYIGEIDKAAAVIDRKLVREADRS